MVHNIPALAAIRFILGVVEAAVMPAMLIYISNWFTKSERSRANTFLILGNPVTVLWMSVVSGYLIQAFGWREMFIIEGVPAVIWAFCWWVLVKDKPSQVNWLAESEKAALQEQLEREQQGIKAVRNYGEAFRSRNVSCCACSILPGASACTVLFCGCRQLSAAAAKIWAWWKSAGSHPSLSGGDHRDDRGLLGLR
jgi:MFS family permease